MRGLRESRTYIGYASSNLCSRLLDCSLRSLARVYTEDPRAQVFSVYSQIKRKREDIDFNLDGPFYLRKH